MNKKKCMLDLLHTCVKTIELRSISRQNIPVTLQAFHLCRILFRLVKISWNTLISYGWVWWVLLVCEYGGPWDDYDQAHRPFRITFYPVWIICTNTIIHHSFPHHLNTWPSLPPSPPCQQALTTRLQLACWSDLLENNSWWQIRIQWQLEIIRIFLSWIIVIRHTFEIFFDAGNWHKAGEYTWLS